MKAWDDSLDEIIGYIHYPMELGNSVACIERLARAINLCDIPKLLKNKLLKTTIEKVLSEGISEREKSEIKGILINSKIARSRSKIITTIDSVQQKIINYSYEVGSANCLFVAKDKNDEFGCIHQITTTAIRDGNSEIKVFVSKLKNDMVIAVSIVLAAIRYYLHGKGLIVSGHNDLDNYSFTVQIGDIGNNYDGESLCLSTAVAIMSSLLDKSISSDHAFTGVVRNNGAIERVDGIKEKIRISIQKGIKTIYIPEDNLDDCEDFKDFKEIVLKPVSSINTVFDNIFGEKDINDLIISLNGEAPEPEGVFNAQATSKALITAVGNRDPFGTPFDKPEELSEGPVLTAFRKVVPDIVCMIATKETIENALRTKVMIEGMTTEKCLVEIKETEIDNPTDYDRLYISILNIIQEIEGLIEGKEVFLSLSSGTPQMHVIFINLLQKNKIKAYPIQVMEPRFVESWDERVRVVRSEYLGIG
jgi:hypothetical protein